MAVDGLSHEGHEMAHGPIIQELVAMQKSLNFIPVIMGKLLKC